MTKFPKVLDGIDVLGYLVAYRLRDQRVDVQEYNRALENIVGQVVEDPRHARPVVRALKVRRRREIDAFAQAVKTVGRLKDAGKGAQATEVVFFRKPGQMKGLPGGGAFGTASVDVMASPGSLRKVILEQRFPGKVAPKYTYLGDVWLDQYGRNLRLAAAPQLPAEIEQRFEAAVARLEEEYDLERGTFPTTVLRARFSSLVQDMCPLAYDAEHIFRFMLATEKNRQSLQVIDEVLGWLNQAAGAKARDASCDMSVLPIPDLGAMRAHLGQVTATEVIQAAEKGMAAIQAYQQALDAGTLDQQKASDIQRQIRRVEEAQNLLSTYQEKFQLQAIGAAEKLMDLKRAFAGALGVLDTLEGKQSHTVSWSTRSRKLPINQRQAGNALIQAGLFGVGRTTNEIVAWNKRFDDGRVKTILTQIELDDMEDVHFIMHETPSEDLQATAPGEGFVKMPTGYWLFVGAAEWIVEHSQEFYGGGGMKKVA